MKVLVTPYLYATSKENPLGFPAHYPWQCAEIADGESVELREGEKLMTVDDYTTYKESLEPIYRALVNEEVGDRDLRSPQTELELQADNPVDYGYKLLEASGEFPEATWNV